MNPCPGSVITASAEGRNAECNATAADDDLAAVIAAWPHLPATVKAGVLAMVEAGVAVPEDGAAVLTGG